MIVQIMKKKVVRHDLVLLLTHFVKVFHTLRTLPEMAHVHV